MPIRVIMKRLRFDDNLWIVVPGELVDVVGCATIIMKCSSKVYDYWITEVYVCFVISGQAKKHIRAFFQFK